MTVEGPFRMVSILMPIITAVAFLLAAVFAVAYVILTESTDWIGRAEVIENRFPGLWRTMNNRPMRLVLITVAIVMLVHVANELHEGAEFASPHFPAPTVPTIEASHPESPSSLRRRTMKVADDISIYLRERQDHHPPSAYPDSSVPNPTDERKKAIQVCLAYDQETMDYYSRHFKDRMIGIVREYNVKGVKTGYLERSFEQRIPIMGGPGTIIEDGPLDEVAQFRSLAYRVDESDNLITF
jgi:hypothetical protein